MIEVLKRLYSNIPHNDESIRYIHRLLMLDWALPIGRIPPLPLTNKIQICLQYSTVLNCTLLFPPPTLKLSTTLLPRRRRKRSSERKDPTDAP